MFLHTDWYGLDVDDWGWGEVLASEDGDGDIALSISGSVGFDGVLDHFEGGCGFGEGLRDRRECKEPFERFLGTHKHHIPAFGPTLPPDLDYGVGWVIDRHGAIAGLGEPLGRQPLLQLGLFLDGSGLDTKAFGDLGITDACLSQMADDGPIFVSYLFTGMAGHESFALGLWRVVHGSHIQISDRMVKPETATGI